MVDILPRIFDRLKTVPEMSSQDPITFYHSIHYDPRSIEFCIQTCLREYRPSVDIKTSSIIVERMMVKHLSPRDRIITLSLLDTVEEENRFDNLLTKVNVYSIYDSMPSELKHRVISMFYKKTKEESKECDGIYIFNLVLTFARERNWQIESFNEVVKAMNTLCKDQLFNQGKYNRYGEDGYPMSAETEVERLRKELKAYQQKTPESCTPGSVGSYLSSFFGPFEK